METCLFCKVIAGQIPGYTVYENTETIVILDIMPSTAGHMLVIHKKHGETILDYTGLQLQQLWTTVQKSAGAAEKAFGTKTLSIGINHGEPEGVHHLHVHVIPRRTGDGGSVMQSLVNNGIKEELNSVKDKLKKYY